MQVILILAPPRAENVQLAKSQNIQLKFTETEFPKSQRSKHSYKIS